MRMMIELVARLMAVFGGLITLALLVGYTLPDNQITFTHFADEDHTSIALLDVESGFLLDVFQRESESVDFLSWSPDGERVMFLSSPGLLAFDISAHVLQTIAYGYNMFPVWSPDGKRVAFVRVESDRFGYNRSAHIYIADATCELCSVRNVTETIHPFNFAPSWSPDSQEIVFFSSLYARSGEMLILNVNTGQVRKLGVADPDLLYSMWSPTGDQIAVWSNFNGMDVIDSTTGDVQYTIGDGRMAVWSPDGQSIAYVTGFDADYRLPLYVRNRDGSNPRLIAHTSSGSPSWSPDSQELVFLMHVDGQREIFVARADGSKLRRLTDNRIYEYNFAWRP
jgi:Tol biopolymer transport system component